MANLQRKLSPADKEYRFKQLEFLMKVADTETTMMIRLAHVLSITNAGAIGVGLLILKDLKDKFNEEWIMLAILSFVVALVSSGVFYIFSFGAMSSAKIAIKDYLFNQDDIGALREKLNYPDSMALIFGSFALSFTSLIAGISIIVSQIRHH